MAPRSETPDSSSSRGKLSASSNQQDPSSPATFSTSTIGHTEPSARTSPSPITVHSVHQHHQQHNNGGPGTGRPSLLAISTSRGKASTSSPSTLPRIKRSVSSKSALSVGGTSNSRPGTPAPVPTTALPNETDVQGIIVTKRGKGHKSRPESPVVGGASHDKDTAGHHVNVRDFATTSSSPDKHKETENRANLSESDNESFDRDNESILTTDVYENQDFTIEMDGDEDDDGEESVDASIDQDTDPRKRLREQLRRTESVRPPSSKRESYRSIPSDQVASPSKGRDGRKIQEQDSDSIASLAPSLPVRPRRYFVLTSAGKPVFASRMQWRQSKSLDSEGEGDNESEETLTSRVGVMQAIISLYAVDNDRIRYIEADNVKIAFYLKSPLYLVAVSDWNEPESVLRAHLDYLYLQILSVVTLSQLQSIFRQRSNFDLRRLLEGTENIMNNFCLNLFNWDFQIMTSSLHVAPVHLGLRDECATALKPPRKYPDILYALLLWGTSIITILRPKGHSIHPSDLHILLNTIGSSTSLRTPNSESWLPICLPKFNNRGFLHAFISYFDNEEQQTTGEEAQDGNENTSPKLGVVLITGDREGFFDMQAWKENILRNLHHTNATHPVSLLSRLRKELSEPPLQPTIPGLRHYLYKSRVYSQITGTRSIASLSAPSGEGSSHASEDFEGIYAEDLSDRKRLVTTYQTIHDSLHGLASSAGGSNRTTISAGFQTKLVYAVNDYEAVLGMSTTTYELYITLPPLVPKKIATESAHALARWAKKNESRLFLVTGPHF